MDCHEPSEMEKERTILKSAETASVGMTDNVIVDRFVQREDSGYSYILPSWSSGEMIVVLPLK